MSRPSSETMWTSTEDCFCHEHERQSRSANSSPTHLRISSADIASTSSGVGPPGREAGASPCSVGSGWLLTKQHLLERVRAQTEPERLDRNGLLGWDVPEVDLGPEPLDEKRLRAPRRRLE